MAFNIENVDFKKLKEAAKTLNETLSGDTGLLKKSSLDPLKVVAVKKEVLVEAFTKAVEGVGAAGFEDELPPEVIDMYNSMYGETESGEEETEVTEEGEEGEEGEEEEEGATETETKPAKGKPADDKAAKKAAKDAEKAAKAKAKAEKVVTRKQKQEQVRSCYGHIAGAVSGMMDVMMAAGTTFGALTEKCDISRSRIKSHINDLKNRGLTVTVKENENWKLTEIFVKEKSLPQ